MTETIIDQGFGRSSSTTTAPRKPRSKEAETTIKDGYDPRLANKDLAPLKKQT